MTPSTRPRHFLHVVPVVALLLALVVAVGPVAAAAPTVAANPALVPFDTTPGKPGTTTLTFTANGTTGLTACGQDNATLPTFPLGAVDPNTPLVVPFPFIQAGTYTFWVSADSACTSAKLAQATASRLGPNGRAGVDDISFTSGSVFVAFGNSSPSSNITSEDVVIKGSGVAGQPPPAQQTFPIPGVQLCFMSADGAQVTINMKVGQDSRSPKGLGSAAATTTVTPVAGQNGCFPIPWIVNGGYTATIARSGASATYGFCIGIGGPNNTPTNPPTAEGIGKCAQVAFFPDVPVNGPGTGTSQRPSDVTVHGTDVTITGSIVTGADNHAVQVCVSAFAPGPGGTAITRIADTANAYNQSGAVNLTPLTLSNFPAGSDALVLTYDITGSGPGGQGGSSFVCPPLTAIQGGGVVVPIGSSAVPGTTVIDGRNYHFAA